MSNSTETIEPMPDATDFDAKPQMNCIRGCIKLSLATLILLLLNQMTATAGDFLITAYGAKSDGQTMNTVAIQQAIDACTSAGGGRVVVPAGIFRSAGIVLKNQVTLYLAGGAVLRGPTQLSEYGKKKTLISADGVVDVGIAGKGTIDGSGGSYMVKNPSFDWKKWTGREWEVSSHFAYKALPRPANIKFADCKNVSIKNITLTNASGWTLHCALCDHVAIESITIRNPLHGVNNDGIDINMCRDVCVTNCDVSTGDDAICLKCNDPIRKRVSRNILVANCRIETECQAFKIGTETLDGFENIVFRDSYIYNRSSNLDERASAGIAIESVDGGAVNGVTVSNIDMVNVRAPIFIRLGNRGHGVPAENRQPGLLKNVLIENVTAHHALMESSITGIPGHKVENVTLRNISIELEGGGRKAWASVAVKEAEADYPAPRMFGTRLPAYGLYCRHAKGLVFDNIRFNNLTPEERPMFVCDDVRVLAVDGMQARDTAGDEPLLLFTGVQNAQIRHCLVPATARLFLKIGGTGTKDIVLTHNEIKGATQVMDATDGAATSAVSVGQ